VAFTGFASMNKNSGSNLLMKHRWAHDFNRIKWKQLNYRNAAAIPLFKIYWVRNPWFM